MENYYNNIVKALDYVGAVPNLGKTKIHQKKDLIPQLPFQEWPCWWQGKKFRSTFQGFQPSSHLFECCLLVLDFFLCQRLLVDGLVHPEALYFGQLAM